MRTTLQVYVSSDDALLEWTVDELDVHCLGFAIQRRQTHGGTVGEPHWLANYASPGPQPHQQAKHQLSDAWPFRCFSWTDHSVDRADVVASRIVPVLAGAPAIRQDLASAWSDDRTIGPLPGAKYQASFNRGFVISQFVSRYLDAHYPKLDRARALTQFKADIGADLENQVRVFLAGQIRSAMLEWLRELATNGGQLFAALFELSDEELIAALERLGTRAHVVLANDSIQQTEHEPAAVARKRDENDAARARLLAASVDVEEGDRFVSPGALAHNKFAVLTTPDGTPTAVWTGSTNWTTTGLCTQLNNGLLISDAGVAQLYLSQWQAIRGAGSEHPATLAKANSTPGAVTADADGISASVHFTRAQHHVDLDALREIVMGAQEGVLFLMFMPGDSGVLADVRSLAASKPDLLVRGVVSELPRGREDEKTGETTALRVALVGAPNPTMAEPRTVEVVQPEGMSHPAAGWAIETTRQQFIHNVGFAIVHSKVLVVDPFSERPTVVAGSHNFSLSASEKNDENFIAVRGDHALAEAYAVNVESAWRHYAGRMGNPHPSLKGIDYLRAGAHGPSARGALLAAYVVKPAVR